MIKVNDSNEKSKIVKKVLLDLLEWFGLAKSTQEYFDQSRELFMFVAKQQDTIIGFITLKETSSDVCEIHCKESRKCITDKHWSQTTKRYGNHAKEKERCMQVKPLL